MPLLPAKFPSSRDMRLARHTVHSCGGAALVRHAARRRAHSRPSGPAAPLALSLYCLAGEAVAPLVRDPPAQTRLALAPHHSTPHACLYDSLRHTPLHRVRACVTARAVGGLQGQAVASRRQRSRAPHAGTARVLLLAVGARRLGRREPLGAAARARAAGERPLLRRAHDCEHGHRHRAARARAARAKGGAAAAASGELSRTAPYATQGSNPGLAGRLPGRSCFLLLTRASLAQLWSCVPLCSLPTYNMRTWTGFLGHWRPHGLLLVESELWPAMLAEVARGVV